MICSRMPAALLRASTVFSFCVAAAGLRAADPTPTERLLPPDTYAYVTCPSVDQLKARFKDSSFGKLWADRAMSDFRQEIETKIDDIGNEFQEHVGLPLVDVLELPKGEATFAVAKTGGELGLILFLNVGEDHSVLETVLEKMEDALEEHEATKSTEDADGTELTIFKLASPEGDSETTRQVAYFVKDMFVVFSSSTELLKGALERWDGSSSESFSQNETYRQILSACRGDESATADFEYFVDPMSIVTAALNANPEQAFQAQMVMAYLPKLGLDKLKGIGGASFLESESFDSVSRTMFYVEPPVSGLLSFFRMPATSMSPPAWVGSSVDQYSGLAWDPAGAYKALSDVYTAFTNQPDGLDAMMDQAAAHPANPGIHPKKDVFDLLTGRTHIVAPHPKSETSLSTPMLFAVGIKNDVSMQSVLEKVSSKIPSLEKRPFEGTTIYEVNTGGSDEEMPSPAFAVSRGHLFIATHVAALEDVIRSGGTASDPLSGSDDYKAVAKHFPSQTSSIGFAKSASQVELFWNQARKGAFEQQVPQIDFSKLPEFKSVEKYFATSGSYIVPIEKGGMMVQFALPVE